MLSSLLRGAARRQFTGSHNAQRTVQSTTRWRRRIGVAGAGFALCAVGVTTSDTLDAVRHARIAGERSRRVASAVIASVIDYKFMFVRTYSSPEDYARALSECHSRSANRVLQALLANGGVFIKLGQHMSSMYLLPLEWTRPMAVLQDKCEPTSFPDIEAMFLEETGRSLDSWFTDFDRTPIGVASLAQVHRATLRDTGEEVAVKIQHPRLKEFVDVDMKVTSISLDWVKRLFPEFELDWLGVEMRENLPLELDFQHEAANAARVVHDFRDVPSIPLYVPRVIAALPRVLIMEFIDGARVDNLEYLAKHNIDRNEVAKSIQEVFTRMVHLNGFFHADPHAGNLLIRPAHRTAKHRHNFDLVLLDHGLYFDLEDQLRLDYSKMWLALIKPGTESNLRDRRKYAEAVGAPPEFYPIFQTAITGRAALEGAWGSEGDSPNPTIGRAGSLMETAQVRQGEEEAIRAAVFREGLIVGIFGLLRKLPRRLLMILKLNDLVRHLDSALQTTHSRVRIWTITARYCALAVWQDDWTRAKAAFRQRGPSVSLILGVLGSWWEFQYVYRSFRAFEIALDAQAYLSKQRLWWHGLWTHGLRGARLEAAGLRA
ncbi:ABC1-domain-containing protein [Exidia glandulosa HHB12029]|uniref:ABC1-domain-containing protein n=1 Tax=Exidia glandulosa HHB12029 TaxID=1314781 RepID=A0A166ATU8_EXIGL|nr:ABC1-domain-containing protein [Exidia glandulosa HHB12029]